MNNNESNNSESDTIFKLNLPKEYRSYVEDLSRMIIIQLVANLLLYASDSRQYPLFGTTFFKTMLFIVVGVSVYWLIFRKLISFGDCIKGESFWFGSNC
jgi:hypothetical protein